MITALRPAKKAGNHLEAPESPVRETHPHTTHETGRNSLITQLDSVRRVRKVERRVRIRGPFSGLAACGIVAPSHDSREPRGPEPDTAKNGWGAREGVGPLSVIGGKPAGCGQSSGATPQTTHYRELTCTREPKSAPRCNGATAAFAANSNLRNTTST